MVANLLTREVKSTEARAVVRALAKMKVFLVPDPRSQSWPLAKVSEGLCRSEGFTGIWSVAFQANEADAVTLDAGLVYEAGLAPYNLKPVVAEFYGSKESKFSLGAQERVCGPSSLLVDAESCLL